MLEKYVEERFPRLMMFERNSRTKLDSVSNDHIDLGFFSAEKAARVVQWHGEQITMMWRLADALDLVAPEVFSHIWYGTDAPERPLYAPLAAAQANSPQPRDEIEFRPATRAECEAAALTLPEGWAALVLAGAPKEEANSPQPKDESVVNAAKPFQHKEVTVPSAHAMAELRHVTRGVEREIGTMHFVHVLQQKWMLEFTGEYVWRDVPIAEEDS